MEEGILEIIRLQTDVHSAWFWYNLCRMCTSYEVMHGLTPTYLTKCSWRTFMPVECTETRKTHRHHHHHQQQPTTIPAEAAAAAIYKYIFKAKDNYLLRKGAVNKNTKQYAFSSNLTTWIVIKIPSSLTQDPASCGTCWLASWIFFLSRKHTFHVSFEVAPNLYKVHPIPQGWSPRFLGNLEKSIATFRSQTPASETAGYKKHLPKPPRSGKRERTMASGVLFHVVGKKARG